MAKTVLTLSNRCRVLLLSARTSTGGLQDKFGKIKEQKRSDIIIAIEDKVDQSLLPLRSVLRTFRYTILASESMSSAREAVDSRYTAINVVEPTDWESSSCGCCSWLEQQGPLTTGLPTPHSHPRASQQPTRVLDLLCLYCTRIPCITSSSARHRKPSQYHPSYLSPLINFPHTVPRSFGRPRTIVAAVSGV